MSTEDRSYADVLDNRKFYVRDRANELAEGAEVVKIAVGYFYIGGFDILRENLQDAESIQLMIGRETNAETKDELVRGFEQDLDELEEDEHTEEGVKRLYELIREDRVDVHIYTQSRFHPKLYLFNYGSGSTFPGAAIVGSSNLSPSGLTGNVELNIEKRDSPTLEYLNDWFDELWEEESQEFKAELLRVIEQSKFGDSVTESEPNDVPDNAVSPYTATKLYIYEQFPEEIEKGILLEDVSGEYRDKLTEFQDDAVRAAEYILNKYNGVIVADSVGLGKSYIGGSLVHEYTNPRSSVLVITPKRLENMWKRLLKDEFPIQARKEFISFSQLSRLDPNEINRYREFDVILVDEAHRLRNQGTKRYDNIQAIGRQDKKYALLTATPIQNSVTDLNNLIKVFADDSDFDIELRGDDPSSIFKKYDKLSSLPELDEGEKRRLERLQEDIEKIIEEVLISRNREYILDNYENITIGGEAIKAPDRVPEMVSASDQDLQTLYRDLIEMVAGSDADSDSGLNLPYVGVERYGGGDDEELMLEYRNASALLIILLFKRLESSLAAFEESIDRLISREEAIRDIAEGRIDRPQDREAILDTFESMDNEGVLDDVDIDEVMDAVQRLGQDQRKAIVEDVSEDLVDLRDMRRMVRDKLRQGKADAKVEKLKDLLSGELQDDKVLIFTQYVPTAEYIFEELTGLDPDRQQMGEVIDAGRRAAYIHGGAFDESIVEQFAPEGQEVDVGLDEEEINVLIATDVLAVGQNLQDSRVVVNYDLRWNPMRMEQRIGRVDRITTSHDELLIYNFIPTSNLEDALGILDRIRTKIDDIASVFGKDAPILEETESIVNKNINIYDQLQEEDMDFKEEGLIGVTSKYDQLRNTVRAFCEEHGIGIEDLQQMQSLKDESRIAFYPAASEQGVAAVANLKFTSGREETRAVVIEDEAGFGGVDIGGQTRIFDIPIVEDDQLAIFQLIQSDDRTKHIGDVDTVTETNEVLEDAGTWNNKILDLSTTPSREISRIRDFCTHIDEDELSSDTVEKAREIDEKLDQYELSDYFENELDKIYRKRNRPGWGRKRTVKELYDKLQEFELAEPEEVSTATVPLTEQLGEK